MRILSWLFFIQLIIYSRQTIAQCDSINVTGDLVVSSDLFMSGVFNVSGNFIVNSGVTVYITPYSYDACGKLTIYANNIIIHGNIDGNYSGYLGGNGGDPGMVVSSLTGDILALNDCSNKDNTGQVTVQGGKSGENGNGLGGGVSGNDGTNGSGPKQQCLSLDDEAGMIGGSGGGGGGGGASYGGSGTSASSGGNGTDDYTASGCNVSTGFVVLFGTGGNGGNNGATYGTTDEMDIEAGSGGAGAGGGGRAYDFGLAGSRGGNGGGMIKLIAQDSLFIYGSLMVNGEDGLNGGIGSNGGQSPKCCSDGCDGCDETTLSCGSGGGGGSGGGSGGGILLRSFYAEVTGSLSAKGGNGGVGGDGGEGVSCVYDAGLFCGSDQTLTSGNASPGGIGGAGGGGRIKIFVDNCSFSNIAPTVNVSGGSSSGTAESGTYFYNCDNVSAEEFSIENLFAFYPNPVSDELNISSKYNQVNLFNVELVNSNGVQIYSETCKSGLTKIDFKELPTGMYLIRIEFNNNLFIKKIIKN